MVRRFDEGGGTLASNSATNAFHGSLSNSPAWVASQKAGFKRRSSDSNFRAPRVPFTRIGDHPRFEYRGAMLDVARHFFTVDEVKQFIEVLALYKLNTLHLHLSDDQGWRI